MNNRKTKSQELAAAKAALENRKIIFLEPQVALVDEKFHHMQETYGPLGIKVVVSSRDHREFDTAISRGEFGIAVVVSSSAASRGDGNTVSIRSTAEPNSTPDSQIAA